MTFEVINFAHSSASFSDPNAPVEFTYKSTTDALGTILASAYFNEVSTLLTIDDKFYITGTDGSLLAKISAVTPNVELQGFSVVSSSVFQALASITPQTDVTGDGSGYVIQFTNVTTNVGSDYDGTSLYTAPVDGMYGFNAIINIADIGAFSDLALFFSVAGVARHIYRGKPDPIKAVDNTLMLNGSIIVPLDKGEVVSVQISIDGGTKTIDIESPTQRSTDFSGYLIAPLV